MASGAGSDVGGGGGGGGGPRLDGELYASIRARQETNLSAEVEGLVRETSALLSPAPATAAGAGATGSGGLDADGNADARLGPDGQPESPAIADLRRAMKLLEQKEADLELAAKIGDALFQENTRLRKENQGTEALRDELDARDEELLAAREETKSLKRRLELLNTTLLQADASNSQLTEQLRAFQEQSLHATSPAVHRTAASPGSPNLSRTVAHESIDGSITRFSGVNTQAISSPGSPGTTLEDGAADRVLPDSDDAVELAAQDLDVALERAEKWRTRALEAEAQVEAIGAQNADTIASLRDKVDVLEIALHRAKKERSRSDMLEAASSRASEERDDLSREIELLQADLELLTQENMQLRADLEESQGIIGARNTREDRAASELSRGPGPEVPHVPSLEDELRGLRVSRDSVSSVTDGPVVRAPKPASAGRADDSEDLDLLFFHFHMTAMSCMSHFSQAGSAGDKMISPATLNTINTMDTRRMYNDAIERGIPPHHWIGYIRDCFAQAHLRSLLKEGGNAYRGLAGPPPSSQDGERNRASSFASLPEGSQSYLAPSRVSSQGHSGMNANGSQGHGQGQGSSSMFARLLHSVAQSPPRQPTDSKQVSSAAAAATAATAAAPSPSPINASALGSSLLPPRVPSVQSSRRGSVNAHEIDGLASTEVIISSDEREDIV